MPRFLVIICAVVFIVLIYNVVNLPPRNLNTQLSSPSPSPEASVDAPLTLVSLDSAKVMKEHMDDKFPEDFNLNKNWQKLECIDTEKDDIGNITKDRLLKVFNDENLSKALEGIEPRKFDRYGPDFGANLWFESACKDGNKYYLLFVPRDYGADKGLFVAHASVGGGPPRDLAIVEDGKIRFASDVGAYLLYSGCGILGIEGDILYLGCGGGDGCCVARSVNEVNLKTLVSKQILYCDFSRDKAKCSDKDKKIYFDNGYDELFEKDDRG